MLATVLLSNDFFRHITRPPWRSTTVSLYIRFQFISILNTVTMSHIFAVNSWMLTFCVIELSYQFSFHSSGISLNWNSRCFDSWESADLQFCILFIFRLLLFRTHSVQESIVIGRKNVLAKNNITCHRKLQSDHVLRWEYLGIFHIQSQVFVGLPVIKAISFNTSSY